MSNEFNLSDLQGRFLERGLSDLKNPDGSMKEIAETPIFDNDGKIDRDLLRTGGMFTDGFEDKLYADKDRGFFDKLLGNEKDNVASKDQLKAIFQAVAGLDGNSKMSEEEIKYFASLGGDPNKIDEEDIKAALEGRTEASKKKEKEIEEARRKALEQMEEKKKAAANKDKEEKAADKSAEPAANDKTKSTFTQNDKIKTDENGNKYVNVEPWDDNANSNNALEKIIRNSYDLNKMGITEGDENYKQLEKAIMDANDNIYGTEAGGWRSEVGGEGRHNAVLYANERVILPKFEPKTSA